MRERSKKQSGYRGVTWHPRNRKWVARATRGEVLIFEEAFSCEHEAAIALSAAVIEYEQSIVATATKKRAEKDAEHQERIRRRAEFQNSQ